MWKIIDKIEKKVASIRDKRALKNREGNHSAHCGVSIPFPIKRNQGCPGRQLTPVWDRNVKNRPKTFCRIRKQRGI